MNSDPPELIQRIQIILAGRDRHEMDAPSLICAAVLVPLLCKDGQWHVLVTQRSQNVEHHKGQISFPGGACEPGDAGLEATALRETFEEIGIPAQEVNVLGALDDFPTITNFVVTPFVGVIPHPFAYRLNGHEVATTIEVPFSFLIDPAHLRVEQWEYEGHLHDVLFWDYEPAPQTVYTIWGATARILKSFLDLIA